MSRFVACSFAICLSLRQRCVSTTGAPVTKEGVLMQDGERLYISYGKKVCVRATWRPRSVVHTSVCVCIGAVLSRMLFS